MYEVLLEVKGGMALVYNSDKDEATWKNKITVNRLNRLDIADRDPKGKEGTIIYKNSNIGMYGIAYPDGSEKRFRVEWRQFKEDEFKAEKIRNILNKDKCNEVVDDTNKEEVSNNEEIKEDYYNNAETSKKEEAFEKNNVVEKEEEESGRRSIESTVSGITDTISIMYEAAIRLMSLGDRLTIPKGVYDRFSIAVLKTLSVNINATKHTAIVKIKFNKDSNRFIACVAEVNGEEYVRLTMARRESNREISSEEVKAMFNNYSKWRKGGSGA